MKNLILACLTFVVVSANAQKSAIQSAIQSLKDNDIQKAKEQIDQATNNESTANNAKAWLLKAVVYQAIGTKKEDMPLMQFIINDNPYVLNLADAAALHSANPDALYTSVEAYSKSMSLDAKYNKEEVMPLINNLAFIHYNNGISALNDSKFQNAAKSFSSVQKVTGMDNGNFYKGMAQIDTLAATSKYYEGYSYYYMGDDKAAAILEESAKSPFITNPDVYVILLELYEKQSNDAKFTETMKKARSKFPKDKRFLDTEINYNLKMGRTEESIAKLKEGIAADPGKVDLYILLGQTYYQIANPSKGTKPANAKEMEANALEQFSKVIEKDASNVYGQFFTGLIYFNQGKEMNDEMIKADEKKYTEMLPKRNELINKSLTYLEKARSLAETAGVGDDIRDNYRSTLYGLTQAYGLLGKAEKAEEAKKKMDALK